MKRSFQIDFLRSAGLQPQNLLLDFGCGTLRGGIPLIEYLNVGNYYGIEARAKALEEGMIELSESGLSDRAPHLIHASQFADLNIGIRFDFIWAFSVLIHFSDDVLSDALPFIARHLAPHGTVYANVNIGVQNQDNSWLEFPHVYRPVEFYEGVCRRAGLSMKIVGTLRELGHVSGRSVGDTQKMLRMKRL